MQSAGLHHLVVEHHEEQGENDNEEVIVDSRSYFEKSRSYASQSEQDFTTPDDREKRDGQMRSGRRRSSHRSLRIDGEEGSDLGYDDENSYGEGVPGEDDYYSDENRSQSEGEPGAMTLAEELMELQNANHGAMGGSGIRMAEGEGDDGGLAFDVEKVDGSSGRNTSAAQQEERNGNNLDNIFLQSGFKRGMRQMCKELVRSGGDTDLASLANAAEQISNQHNRAGSAL